MANSEQGNNIHRPVSISRLLADVCEHKKWRTRLELHRVFEFWDDVVGREIAAVARPALIRGHVLWVKVTDSVWMQQLHLQKMLLLQKINQQLGEENVADIRFQLNSSMTLSPEPEPAKAKQVILDSKKEQEFDRLISSLENEDLRASLKRLWVRMQTKGQQIEK